ncbi:MAG: hypothetical protein V3U65_19390 [Granulosicoccaceae bacterium]
MKSKLDDAQSIMQLAKKLKKYSCVSKFDDNEPEAERLAHSLSDFERSFNVVLKELLPILIKADGNEEVQEALLDIGEELRHILYHIKDPKFFAYLND